MGSDEAKLIVKFEAENAKLHKELERSQRKLRGFETSTKKQISGVSRQFQRSTEQMARYVKRAVGLFAFGAAIDGLVSTSREFEKLKAQLETIEGSSQKAQLAFDRIQAFATKTPYQLDEVVKAFVSLKNLGLEPSEDALTAYGNTAASMGKDLQQLIEAVADASTGEFERLKEFGIKARQEGERVSFTFRGVTTEVGKNAADIQRYLQSLGNTEFAGGMARQMDTLNGVTSNLQDAVSRLALKIDSETGLTGSLTRALGLLTKFINGLSGVSRSIAEIETEIAKVQAQIASGGGAGRGRNRTGSNAFLQNRLEELNAELQAAQLTSTNLVELERGAAKLQMRIDDLKVSISEGQAAGEAITSGRGRNKTLTDLGRQIKELETLEAQLESVSQRIQGIQLEGLPVNVTPRAPALEGQVMSASTTADSSIASDLADPFTEYRDQLQRQIDLYGEVSQAAVLRYDLEHGMLGKLNQQQADYLVGLQAHLDTLNSEAEFIKDVELAAEGLKQQMSEHQKQAENYAKQIDDTLVRGISDAIAGVEDWEKTFLASIAKIGIELSLLKVAQVMGISPDQPSLGVGSAITGLIGFEGGGYTGDGPRAGGMDGKGGFPAMLHPQEVVTDLHGAAVEGRSGSGQGQPPVHVAILNDPGEIAQVMASAHGQKVIVEAIRKHSGEVSRYLSKAR